MISAIRPKNQRGRWRKILKLAGSNPIFGWKAPMPGRRDRPGRGQKTRASTPLKESRGDDIGTGASLEKAGKDAEAVPERNRR
jgi:hypothetical protein